ncbi:MAG: hypothetical protein LAP87_27975 [Acidobacteriia bacterium]|nr:hypothetical protein [Terriglobia bacterium]
MTVFDSTITNVTIQNLTFDGNRYGFGQNGLGISCQRAQLLQIDLFLTPDFYLPGGSFTVKWVNFINSPDTALFMAGDGDGKTTAGSTVAMSNFGMGGWGIGAYGGTTEHNESPQESATRFTAVYIKGSYGGAYYNNIFNAGTAGITLEGSHQYAYGNLLGANRYEISDGVGGGQLTLYPDSSYASVVGNVINGNCWPSSLSQYLSTRATGCPAVPDQYGRWIWQKPNGVDANGIGHVFYNNEIEQHMSGGMEVNLASAAQITISSINLWYPQDTLRYIEANGYNGINLEGPPAYPALQGVRLDSVFVRNNAGAGVRLVGVLDSDFPPGYLGFINGYCMTGNTSGPSTFSGAHPTYSSPSTTTQYLPLNPNGIRAQSLVACPAYTGNVQVPAPSGDPTWHW